MRVIGIDPGKTGGFALIANGKLEQVVGFNKDLQLCRKMFSFLPAELPYHVCIERVTASPQMGVVSAFTFGRWAEAVESAAIHHNYSPLFVRPQVWQNAIGVYCGGNKSKLYDHAKRRYPKEYEQKLFNKATSDAVLIAHYGYRLLQVKKGNNNAML